MCGNRDLVRRTISITLSLEHHNTALNPALKARHVGEQAVESQGRIPGTPDPKEMVLAKIDLPQGFSVYEEEPWDNISASRAWSDRDKWIKSFEYWGRYGGFETTFETDETDVLGDLIQSTAAIFHTEEGAQAAFWAMRAGLEDNLRRRYSAWDRKLIEMEELVRPKTGDGTFALHVNASGTAFDTPVIVDLISLSFLREGVIASLVWRSFQSSVPERQLIRLAAKQDQRVITALQS